MEEGSFGRFILDQITEGQLDWVALSSPFDIMVLEGPSGRKEFPMYSGEKAYIQGLKEKFPQEEAAIDKYIKLVKVTWTCKGSPCVFLTRLTFIGGVAGGRGRREEQSCRSCSQSPPEPASAPLEPGLSSCRCHSGLCGVPSLFPDQDGFRMVRFLPFFTSSETRLGLFKQNLGRKLKSKRLI